MARCTACQHEAAAGSRFCPACGATLEGRFSEPTETSFRTGSSPGGEAARTQARVATGSLDRGRFLPGTVLAGRYRIFGLIGRGGMGEVYRADDLKLGQPVALKFLPLEVERDEARLERFLGEVRVARQITHTNVCRVYDVVELDGAHCLSMEYIDGEDLASLLRRIGRLPKDKAIEIARQLCAGLAAAHEQGILHRDLKPANVMIDGRGKARITDFGLAGLAGERTGVGGGTPGYMAPEQLAGQSASVRSDLYALGLTLYELFTGRRAFDAASAEELARLQRDTTPSGPSSFVEGFDPAVERVILRCLEREPRERPASALSIAAALPGGDPLAAALAAGETPSPQLLAEAVDEGGLRPGAAVALLAGILAGFVVIAWLGPSAWVLPRLHLDKPKDALVVEARELIGSLGHEGAAADRASGFDWSLDAIEHAEETGSAPDRWKVLEVLKPAPLTWWYRESPRPLVNLAASGSVSFDDPPPSISGMVSLRLDARGRLLDYLAVPPERDETQEAPREIDWSPFFAKAGLDGRALKPVPPVWNPLVDCDARAAWDGVYPGQPDVPVHLEGGAYRGRPVYFRTILPWTKPGRDQSAPRKPSERVAIAVFLTLLAGVFVGGILLARRNLLLGRGDRRGAARVAGWFLVATAAARILERHHVASIDEVDLLFDVLAWSLVEGAVIWVLYIALEPAARRLWPHALITWSRLLAGRFRDPQIGRDVLIGGAAGIGLDLLADMTYPMSRWLGLAAERPGLQSHAALYGLPRVASEILFTLTAPLGLAVLLFFLFLLLRILVRRQWAAFMILFVLVWSVGLLDSPTWLGLAWRAVFAFVLLGVLLRFGLLALAALQFFLTTITLSPPSLDFSTWYAGLSTLPLAVATALAVYAFHIARGRRPLLRVGWLPD